MPHRSASPEAMGTMAADVSLRRRAGVSLHLLDDEGVLLDSAGQTLYRLNTTGAFIWCCIEDDASAAECVARLRSTFGISERDASGYVAAAIDDWSALGVLGDTGQSAQTGRPLAAASSEEPTAPPPFVAVSQREYRLLDTRFRLRFASRETASYIDRFLAPFRESGPEAVDSVIIDVRESDGRRALYHGDRPIERWAAANELVPIAKIALLTCALERSRDFAALHAGAVCRRLDGPCVVIAGPSGAGKSTLVAGLATRGFHSLGDDTIALARDTLAVRGVPFGICLKSGAWRLLSARIPGLVEMPIHRRPDGKRVKYFVPSEGPHARGATAQNPAHAVVFPNRVDTGATGLVRLSHADALTRLAAGFCPLDGAFDADRIERLIRWVRGITCFELRYSSLDEGIQAIGELCP